MADNCRGDGDRSEDHRRDDRDRQHGDPVAVADVREQAGHHHPQADVSRQLVAVAERDDHAAHQDARGDGDGEPRTSRSSRSARAAIDIDIDAVDDIGPVGAETSQCPRQTQCGQGPDHGVDVPPVDQLVRARPIRHERDARRHQGSSEGEEDRSVGATQRCCGPRERPDDDAGAESDHADRGHQLVPRLTDERVDQRARRVEAGDHRLGRVRVARFVPHGIRDPLGETHRSEPERDGESRDRHRLGPPPTRQQHHDDDDGGDRQHRQRAAVHRHGERRGRDRCHCTHHRATVDERLERDDGHEEHQGDQRLGPGVGAGGDRARRQRDDPGDPGRRPRAETGPATDQHGQTRSCEPGEECIHGQRCPDERLAAVDDGGERCQGEGVPGMPRQVIEHVPARAPTEPTRHRELSRFVGRDVEHRAISGLDPATEGHDDGGRPRPR
ncbi:MAG: hypothetical protein CL424_12280 [Acidimicrobiaceae bacterium]|nr:hypothetical protein [Acidimicrobiaceae bacterium]